MLKEKNLYLKAKNKFFCLTNRGIMNIIEMMFYEKIQKNKGK